MTLSLACLQFSCLGGSFVLLFVLVLVVNRVGFSCLPQGSGICGWLTMTSPLHSLLVGTAVRGELPSSATAARWSTVQVENTQ